MTIACADCGLIQVIPPLEPGATAACHRCDRYLARRSYTHSDVTLACPAATLVLIIPALLLPLMDGTIKDLVFQQSRLVTSVPVIYSEVWFLFAFGFFFLAFLFPFLHALFQVVVLGSLRFKWRLWQRGRMFRWSDELRIWCMTDVVVIAGIVAWLRARIPAQVVVRGGAWSYMAVAILFVIGDYALDRRDVWNQILHDREGFPERRIPSCDSCEMIVDWRRSGDACPRCGSRLDRNLLPRFMPALAALAAAVPLCVPAYSAAIMVNDQITGVLEQTVIGTVQLLADRGYWEFGVILLLAGVVIPMIEIAGLAWLLFRVRVPTTEGLVRRTRVYRILRKLVRWPMIIPFVAAVAAPIVKYHGIDEIVAGPAATPLFVIIVLLMIAMRFYEPRMMWRAAGERV